MKKVSLKQRQIEQAMGLSLKGATMETIAGTLGISKRRLDDLMLDPMWFDLQTIMEKRWSQDLWGTALTNIKDKIMEGDIKESKWLIANIGTILNSDVKTKQKALNLVSELEEEAENEGVEFGFDSTDSMTPDEIAKRAEIVEEIRTKRAKK